MRTRDPNSRAIFPRVVFAVLLIVALSPSESFILCQKRERNKKIIIIMADPRIKQIRIKSGVVKRLTKEKTSYEKEVVQEENRMQKMKDDGKDEYVIKKQGEVLQESKAMIPDCLKRLNTAYLDLTNILKSEADLKEAKEYVDAEEACVAAKEMLCL